MPLGLAMTALGPWGLPQLGQIGFLARWLPAEHVGSAYCGWARRQHQQTVGWAAAGRGRLQKGQARYPAYF